MKKQHVITGHQMWLNTDVEFLTDNTRVTEHVRTMTGMLAMSRSTVTLYNSKLPHNTTRKCYSFAFIWMVISTDSNIKTILWSCIINSVTGEYCSVGFMATLQHVVPTVPTLYSITIINNTKRKAVTCYILYLNGYIHICKIINGLKSKNWLLLNFSLRRNT